MHLLDRLALVAARKGPPELGRIESRSLATPSTLNSQWNAPVSEKRPKSNSGRLNSGNLILAQSGTEQKKPPPKLAEVIFVHYLARSTTHARRALFEAHPCLYNLGSAR